MKLCVAYLEINNKLKIDTLTCQQFLNDEVIPQHYTF